jgi:hypothetical protein
VKLRNTQSSFSSRETHKAACRNSGTG